MCQESSEGRVLREHLETFLAHGFWRVSQMASASSCALDHLVGFSCKGRGFCPSWRGRRTADVAAHRAYHVILHAPVRRWVQSPPQELRFRLIPDADPYRAVASAFLGALFARCVRVARALWQGVGPECYAPHGAIPSLQQIGFQKFGLELQINPHLHALVIDGAFVTERPGAAAKREATGLPRGALVVSSNAYPLRAATRIEADDLDSLGRLLRYMARPLLAHGRLMLREHGKVLRNLHRTWRAGVRAFVFDPFTFIGWLAALVPRVPEHQLSHHGCLAPASPLRDDVLLRPSFSRPSRSEAAGAAPN